MLSCRRYRNLVAPTKRFVYLTNFSRRRFKIPVGNVARFCDKIRLFYIELNGESGDFSPECGNYACRAEKKERDVIFYTIRFAMHTKLFFSVFLLLEFHWEGSGG